MKLNTTVNLRKVRRILLQSHSAPEPILLQMTFDLRTGRYSMMSAFVSWQAAYEVNLKGIGQMKVPELIAFFQELTDHHK